jgi:parvulin-like peptidyl-prolyl isomerase
MEEAQEGRVRREMVRLYGELLKKPAAFADLAQKYSQHSESASKGGDMGWLAGDSLLPVLVPTLAGLKAGEISLPVLSGQGWHILKLIDKEASSYLPLSKVRLGIVLALQREASARKEQELLEQLIRQKPPKVYNERLQPVAVGAH